MPLTAEIRVFGEEVVRRRFMRLADNFEDASDAFRAIAGILERATARNFATRGVYGGSRWRDLSPARREFKRRHNLDPRILQATHRLHDSLVSRGHAEHIEEVGRDRLRWGSRVPYGVFHQSTAPRRVIPYRPPVRLPEKDKRQITRELQASFMGAFPSQQGAQSLLRDVRGRFRAVHSL